MMINATEAIRSLEEKIEDLTHRLERAGDATVLRAERRKLERQLEAIYEATNR